MLLLQRCCLSQTEQAYSLERSPSPRPRILASSHTTIRSPGLPFNGLHPYPCNYLRKNGKLSWPCWLTNSGWFTTTCQPYKLSTGKGKSASQRLTYLLLSYDANLGLYGFVAPFRPISINVAVCLLNVLMSLAFSDLHVCRQFIVLLKR